MEWFFYALIALAIYGYIKSKTGSKGRKATKRTPGKKGATGKPGLQIPAWLTERWDVANAAQAAQDFSQFGKWYFDEPSPYQIERLESDGWILKAKPSKGQASDLIGIGEEADPDQLETLAFFKIKRRTMSQTEAREALRQIFADPDNVAAWEARPADSGQKLFFQFFDMKMPKGISRKEAEAMIDSALENHPEWDSVWADLSHAWDELSDPETREDYDIRKPTPAQCASAAKAVKADQEELDVDHIAEKLQKLFPQLSKS